VAGVAVDIAGNVYIGDWNNFRVRKISTDGTITTVAGTFGSGYTGDGGLATKAQLNAPKGIAVDATGNLYIGDYNNGRIRMVTPDGSIWTIAGNGHFGYGGDGGPATSAQLYFPSGVAVDGSGKVYVADGQNNVIRLLTPGAQSIGVPSIRSSSGVISASGFGAFAAVAPGSWIEIYGRNLASTTASWSGPDFNNGVAPTSLQGVSVSIGGQPAFVNYISPGQIDALLPSNAMTGAAPIIVTNANGTSDPFYVTVSATQPSLLAPTTFMIGGKQYVAAFNPDGTFALPQNAIVGVSSTAATPGQTVVMYGIGFGPVSDGVTAGTLPTQQDSLTLPLVVSFGTTNAQLAYAGLAMGLTGLYQINVVVPQVSANSAEPITFTLGTTKGSQTLYIAVN